MRATYGKGERQWQYQVIKRLDRQPLQGRQAVRGGRGRGARAGRHCPSGARSVRSHAGGAWPPRRRERATRRRSAMRPSVCSSTSSRAAGERPRPHYHHLPSRHAKSLTRRQSPRSDRRLGRPVRAHGRGGQREDRPASTTLQPRPADRQKTLSARGMARTTVVKRLSRSGRRCRRWSLAGLRANTARSDRGHWALCFDASHPSSGTSTNPRSFTLAMRRDTTRWVASRPTT